MKERFIRGEAGSQVSEWNPSAINTTSNSFTSSILPYGLQLRQTKNAGDTSVTIPSGITWVYAICVGGGGGGRSSGGGGAGGVAWGWTLATSSCVVGAGGTYNVTTSPGYTRYGHIIAGGGGSSATGALAPVLGGGGGTGFSVGLLGATNYWGISGSYTLSTGQVNTIGAGGGGGSSTSGTGGAGISGGGAYGSPSGGSGLAGGGGGSGLGGTGINILTGATYTPTGSGGAGIAGNGSGVVGGPGGGGGGGATGGNGGNGILYLFY